MVQLSNLLEKYMSENHNLFCFLVKQYNSNVNPISDLLTMLSCMFNNNAYGNGSNSVNDDDSSISGFHYLKLCLLYNGFHYILEAYGGNIRKLDDGDMVWIRYISSLSLVIIQDLHRFELKSGIYKQLIPTAIMHIIKTSVQLLVRLNNFVQYHIGKLVLIYKVSIPKTKSTTSN